MEKPKRARRRKLDTAKADLEPPRAVPGGQGVHREVESEGHEEKCRAVIDGGHPEDEPVGQRWGKVEPAPDVHPWGGVGFPRQLAVS